MLRVCCPEIPFTDNKVPRIHQRGRLHLQAMRSLMSLNAGELFGISPTSTKPTFPGRKEESDRFNRRGSWGTDKLADLFEYEKRFNYNSLE
jgi:hypothetical protein